MAETAHSSTFTHCIEHSCRIILVGCYLCTNTKAQTLVMVLHQCLYIHALNGLINLFFYFTLSLHVCAEVCGKCGEALSRSQPAVRAMDKLFHSHCFCCVTCQRPLQGMQFYDRDGTPECEECYVVSQHACTHTNSCCSCSTQNTQKVVLLHLGQK